LFAKVREDAPDGFFTAEAAGLRWLAEAGTVQVPEVIAADATMLVTTWVHQAPATPATAEAFGRGLAGLHAAGAPTFGLDRSGWIGTLPLDNTPAPDWPTFYVERRCRPYLRQARNAGTLSSDQAAVVEQALDRVADHAGPAEPPARLHGDLWSGNVLYGDDGAWLVDPAAHGGHRETDLAMLALFGAPHLDRTLAAYAETAPLADGWRERVALHQLHPLLVHCALFGTGYAGQTLRAARTVR
ncbi:MAG TPA: fructosamine kinase family protein, partial [Cryptosporangiaceae bacterium]|nr:fructosamine kinase family protein [Cryptosporangiaceae bacterium]